MSSPQTSAYPPLTTGTDSIDVRYAQNREPKGTPQGSEFDESLP